MTSPRATLHDAIGTGDPAVRRVAALANDTARLEPDEEAGDVVPLARPRPAGRLATGKKRGVRVTKSGGYELLKREQRRYLVRVTEKKEEGTGH